MKHNKLFFTILLGCLIGFVMLTESNAQTYVTLPGNFQSELGCGSDWDPACTMTDLSYNSSTGNWYGSFTIPAGNWEYKVAIDHAWDENYGDGGVQNGANITLNLAASAQITFVYDPVTHIVTTVYNGDLTLISQAEIDAFNYTEVTGILIILESVPGNITNLDGLSSLTTVGGHFSISLNTTLTNLDGLAGLTTVGGSLQILNNAALTHLDGLSSLTTVGGFLYINHNTALTNLDGLSSLTTVGGFLQILSNTALTNLDGLSSLTTVGGFLQILSNTVLTNLDGLSVLTTLGGDLTIHSNAALTNLDGLSSLTSVVGSIIVYNNPTLTNLDGLSSVTTVGEYLYIAYNSALTNLDGLSSVTTVGIDLDINNNTNLTNLDGLSGLSSVVGDLFVQNNNVLLEFCGLYALLNGSGLAGSYTVTGNASNPTIADIISGGPCYEEWLEELISSVDGSDIHDGTKNSLVSSLNNAMSSLQNGNTGAAINQLEAFINKVQAQRGKKIDEATANEWIAEAQDILDAIQSSLSKSNDEQTLTSSDITPLSYSLDQNFPNPFNPTTQIKYGIPEASNVKIEIFSVTGEVVATLVNEFVSEGYHTVIFNASNLSSGMYLYRISAGSFIETKKMILMK